MQVKQALVKNDVDVLAELWLALCVAHIDKLEKIKNENKSKKQTLY
jgi:hypothetical protein